MSARPHCSSIAATSGSAPTTCVSTRVPASMLRLLGKRETNPQLAKNAKIDLSCPHQPPRWGAEREDFVFGACSFEFGQPPRPAFVVAALEDFLRIPGRFPFLDHVSSR